MQRARRARTWKRIWNQIQKNKAAGVFFSPFEYLAPLLFRILRGGSKSWVISLTAPETVKGKRKVKGQTSCAFKQYCSFEKLDVYIPKYKRLCIVVMLAFQISIKHFRYYTFSDKFTINSKEQVS